MLIYLVSIALFSSQLGSEGPRNSDEFAALMKEAYKHTRSVSFIFEGEISFLERSGTVKPRSEHVMFQGLYALRTGPQEAGLLEIYQNMPPKPPSHTSKAFLRGILEDSRFPLANKVSIDPKTNKPKTIPGGFVSLCGSPTPQWFVYTWYFSAYLNRDYLGMLFENLGWDNVDGNRCLKVKLGSVAGAKSPKYYKIFWIDLVRAAHPLKVETYLDGKMLDRIDGIELLQIPDVDGKKLWFPVKGVLNTYGTLNGEFYDYPVSRETYGVVLGSLQLNRDLPDTAFVVHTMPRTELANASSLKESHPIEVGSSKPERPKTDPASVKARLDAALAEADKQAAEVKASSPARESWSSTTIAQMVVGVVGIAMIGTALVWRWRQS